MNCRGIDKKIASVVNKAKRRIFLYNSIDYIFKLSTFGIIMCIIIALISRIVPIYGVYTKTLWITILFILCGIIYSMIKYPKDIDAAVKIDSMGLQERVVTAVQLKGDNTSIALIQKKDTLNVLKNIDLKTMTFNINKKYIKMFLIFSIILLSTAFLPDPLKNKAAQIHDVNIAKKEQIKKIKKVKKDINKNEYLKTWQKKELNYNIEKLQNDIKDSKTKEELNKALQRNYKKLELVKQNYNNENLNKTAETLMKNKMTKQLGIILKNGDKKAFEEGMKALPDKLKNLSDEEKDNLKEDYKKLAEEIKNDKELAKAVLNFANSIANGQMGDVSEYLSKISDTMSEMMQSDAEFKNAVQSMRNALVQANDGSSKANNYGNNAGLGSGGSGAGNTSSKEASGENNSLEKAAGISKKGKSDAVNIKEYDKVFTSKSAGGEAEKSEIKGKMSNTGEADMIKTEKGISITGNSVPYDKVIGDYKDKAMDNINNSYIPEQMKEIVKNYFSSLEKNTENHN